MAIQHKPATPLPWESTRHDDKHGNWTTCDIGQAVNLGGRIVARTLGVDNDRAQDAAYLAHAANAYPNLVEALLQFVQRANSGMLINNPRASAERREESAQACETAEAILHELGEAPQ